jgi:hypothetical protein
MYTVLRSISILRRRFPSALLVFVLFNPCACLAQLREQYNQQRSSGSDCANYYKEAQYDSPAGRYLVDNSNVVWAITANLKTALMLMGDFQNASKVQDCIITKLGKMDTVITLDNGSQASFTYENGAFIEYYRGPDTGGQVQRFVRRPVQK